jgi:replication-associated recombination protein RarA
MIEVKTYKGLGLPNYQEEFTFKRIPKKVREYFEELLGPKEAKKLIAAMRRYDFIIINGPQGATGKTTLASVLRAIGYNKVIEKWQTATITASEPLSHRKSVRDVFEQLEIFEKH